MKSIIEKIEEQIVESKKLEQFYTESAEKAHAAWNLEQASFFRSKAFYQKRLRDVLYKLIDKEGE